MTDTATRRELLLVTCAATPLRRIGELVDLLHAARWQVTVLATPTAASWPFLAGVAERTGRPVLHRMPRPDEPWPDLAPDAVLVAPATFNTLNKWATGVNDNLAVGLLNEYLGGTVPIVAAVHVKPALAAHPAFAAHLDLLRTAGVRLTDPAQPFTWQAALDLLPAH
ncbi:flavoprotein [Actinoplanes teichomyceticus]|uniref:Flavoprotein n=1 Tax=Actinoplanes teichomyceticus TaxID=1867 RepID=A0A561WAA3_ACTTI|nr:flavoprotein [Actinoplanes teichomyceticus]TWG20785.1 flavoprotein [Actinoplanes teichomyceticus]GIF14440.1 flavoprotein [Actinoplanes teichomyceticus]